MEILGEILLFAGLLLLITTFILFLKEKEYRIIRKQWIKSKQFDYEELFKERDEFYEELFKERDELYAEWQARSGEDWIWG